MRPNGDGWGALAFMTWDRDAVRRTSESELRLKLRTEGDPELPPPAKPGDGYILLALVIGAIVGGVGAWLGARAYHISPFATMVGGVLVGALLGTLLGDRVRKAVLARRKRAAATRHSAGGAVQG